jgi:hypothetical protein
MKKTIVNAYILVMLTLVWATWMVSALMISGCGKKALPEPPSGIRPPKVMDLAYSISENTIKLSWTIPQTNDTAKSRATGFLIYRSKQTSVEPDCPNCPIYFLKIGDVLVRDAASGVNELSVVFTQTIESGYRYLYKVKAYDRDGVAGKDSNVIDFTY